MIREGGIGEVRVYRQVQVDGKWRTAPSGTRKVDRWKIGQVIWPTGDAKPKTVYRFGATKEATERDLRLAVAAAMGDRTTDGITGDSSLAEALEAVAETVWPKLARSTRDEYQRDLKRGLIDPKIMGRKLSALDKVVLTRELQRIACKHGHCVRHVRSMLSQAFDLSSLPNPVHSIPTKALSLPDPKDVTPLGDEQRDHLLTIAKSRATFPGKGAKASTKEKLQSVYESIVFGLSTGCRIGEVLALRWENVDLDNRIIRVIDGGSDGTTKTRAGVRRVPVSDDLYRLLSARRKRVGGTGYVFGQPSDPEAAWDSSNFQDEIADLREAAGIEGFHYHQLRHTFIVSLLRAGKAPYAVAQIAGHSSPAVTLRLYAKFLPDEDLSHLLDALPSLAV